MTVNSNKDLARLVREARAAGWSVSFTGSTHLLFVAPDGARIVCSGTPRSGAAVKKTRSRMRRHGFGEAER